MINAHRNWQQERSECCWPAMGIVQFLLKSEKNYFVVRLRYHLFEKYLLCRLMSLLCIYETLDLISSYLIVLFYQKVNVHWL